jgi:hypothetical protein
MGRMMDQMMAGRMNQMTAGLGNFRTLRVAMPLTDGQWLSFASALPDTGQGFPGNCSSR